VYKALLIPNRKHEMREGSDGILVLRVFLNVLKTLDLDIKARASLAFHLTLTWEETYC